MRKIWGKFGFLKRFFHSHQFWLLSEKVWAFWQKLFRQGCQDSILSVQRKLWPFEGKLFFLKNFYFFNHLRTFNKKIPAFWQNFLTSLSICNTCVQRNFLKKNNFYQNNVFSKLFRTMTENFSAFFQNYFVRNVKPAVLESMGTFSGKKFSDKNYLFDIIFWHWANIFLSCQKKLTNLSKLHSSCSWEQFVQTCFLRKKKSIFSSFLDFELRFFGLLSEFFWRGCQNYILRVQRNLLTKVFISEKKKLFLSFSGNERDNFRLLGKKFDLFVKTAVYVSIVIILRKKYFLNSYFSELFSVFVWNNLGLLSNTFLRGSQNYVPHV